MQRRIFWLALVAILVLLPIHTASSIPEDLEVYNYSYVPLLNLTYVQLEPGESLQERTVALENRYTFPMENVTMNFELYRYRTLEESLAPSEISSPPSISSTGLEYTTSMGAIPADGNGSFTHPVSTTKDTPEGTYFIRVSLEFDANGSHYQMLSRGHFDDDLWKEALSNSTVTKEVEGQNISTGGINLDLLGVDGIIAETSITVEEPLGLGMFFVLAAITGFMGVMALVFYLQEEKGMFPKAEWAYQRAKGRWLRTRLAIEKKLKKE